MNTSVIGTTSKQMMNSVGGSIYIWPDVRTIEDAIRLAEHLGRIDLRIYTASDLNFPDKFRGLTIYGVTVDHACDLTRKEKQTLTDVIYPRLREQYP